MSASVQFSSVQLLSRVWKHSRPPCPPPTPRAYSNACPLCRWCHPAISSSVVPFSSGRQSFPDQGLFKWVSSPRQVAKVLEFQLQHSTLGRLLPSHWFSVLLFVKWGVGPNCPLSFDGLSCLAIMIPDLWIHVGSFPSVFTPQLFFLSLLVCMQSVAATRGIKH